MWQCILVVLLVSTQLARATDLSEDVKAGKVLRVGGDYLIEKIETVKSNDFKVYFVNTASSGKMNKLLLRTNHVHVGLSEGTKIRLSAEVLGEHNGIWDVTQILLFLPKHNYGVTPVWILSNQYPSSELRGAKWLEMHAPQADYEVM